jgi:hypothetical protein
MGLALLVGLASWTGCGASAGPTQKKEEPFAAASEEGELEKIKAALIKAGIKNPPAAVLEGEKDEWVVVITPDGVGPNGEPPPGRPIPLRVIVNKKTFEVTKPTEDPSKRKGGSEMSNE